MRHVRTVLLCIVLAAGCAAPGHGVAPPSRAVLVPAPRVGAPALPPPLPAAHGKRPLPSGVVAAIELQREYRGPYSRASWSFSDDETLLVAPNPAQDPDTFGDGSLQVWNAATGAEVFTTPATDAAWGSAHELGVISSVPAREPDAPPTSELRIVDVDSKHVRCSLPLQANGIVSDRSGGFALTHALGRGKGSEVFFVNGRCQRRPGRGFRSLEVQLAAVEPYRDPASTRVRAFGRDYLTHDDMMGDYHRIITIDLARHTVGSALAWARPDDDSSSFQAFGWPTWSRRYRARADSATEPFAVAAAQRGDDGGYLAMQQETDDGAVFTLYRVRRAKLGKLLDLPSDDDDEPNNDYGIEALIPSPGGHWLLVETPSTVFVYDASRWK